MKRTCVPLALLATLFVALTLALSTGAAQRAAPSRDAALSREDDAFLEELSKRTFMFFWEQADPSTGIVRDRSRTDGSPSPSAREIGSIASVGFGLSGLCIAAERGWLPREQVFHRARTTLRFFAVQMEHQRGWFFHFVNLRTGAREWRSELSSIDTALLLGGVLTARRCFESDPVSSATPTPSTAEWISGGCWRGIPSCCLTAGSRSRAS